MLNKTDLEHEVFVVCPSSSVQLADVIDVVDSAIEEAVRKYSRLVPAREILIKEWDTTDGETVDYGGGELVLIDVFQKIHPLWLSFQVFDTYDNVISDVDYLTRTQGLAGEYPELLFRIFSEEFYSEMVEKYCKSNTSPLIVKGRLVYVQPGVKYCIIYSRMKTLEELEEKDKDPIINLGKIYFLRRFLLSGYFVADAGLRSVRISGIAISFDTPDRSKIFSNLDYLERQIVNKYTHSLPQLV